MNVCILKFERSVKQVLYSHSDESISFGQAVTDRRVYNPELIFSVDKNTRRYVLWLEFALLIYIGCYQLGTEPRGMIEIDPEWNTMCLDVPYSSDKLPFPVKPLVPIFSAESEPGMGCPVEVGSGELLFPIYLKDFRNSHARHE
jgi:hypothetical protein